MNAKRLIESVTLRSGPKGLAASLTFSPASVNVFVGPNHSGKSLLLRELQAALQRPDQAPFRKVLQNITFTPWTGKQKETLADELRAMVKPSPDDPTSSYQLSGPHRPNYKIHKPWFDGFLAQLPKLRDLAENQFMREYFLLGSFLMLGGAERLSVLNSTDRERPGANHYNLVLSNLFYTDSKRKKAQDIIHDAFKYHFVIDPLGQKFEAKISTVAPSVGLERSLTEEAVSFFKPCTQIQDMSDGVRAFCGMVCSVVASDAKVILLDEPEAFLHQALCIKLAKELCQIARINGQQLFIATHSAPFLMGCVQAGIDVNIIRLTYRENAATSRILKQEELVQLMRQPLLRSIGALSGIFYESVVVTESDSDRAFYDEVSHRCLNARHGSGIADCLFLNAQNWQTTARIIAPLRRLGVAAAAIVDIDLLLESKSESFQTLMEAAGMPAGTRQSLGQLRGVLHAILKPMDKALKSQGISCVNGDNRRDLENFIDQMANYGILVVPVGELENWLPDLQRIPGTGKSEWLLRTFEAMGDDAANPSYLQPSDNDVWDFLNRARLWLHDPNRLGMAED